MNIKTLEVCSLVPANKMAHERWKACTHPSTSYEYIHGRNNRYCSECKIDLLPTENIDNRVQIINKKDIKATNQKLKTNFNIKRRDEFICWNCFKKYRTQSKNALTNRMFCSDCAKIISENRYFDVIGINDLGIQGFIENTNRADQIANGIVFTQGFNQNDLAYSGLGRYTYGHARKDSVQREIRHINKAYVDLNKGTAYKNKLGRSLKCNWKCKVGFYEKDGKYYWTFKKELKDEYRAKKVLMEDLIEDLNTLWFDEQEGDLNDELEDFYDD